MEEHTFVSSYDDEECDKCVTEGTPCIKCAEVLMDPARSTTSECFCPPQPTLMCLSV